MTINQSRDLAGALAFDAQGLDQLKLQARQNPEKAAAAAAKQFEGMFLGMVLKSMREATPQGGLFDNEQTKLYTSMLDQQLAQKIALRGTGLSEVLTRQLGGTPAGNAPKNAASTMLDPLQTPLQLPTLALARLSPEAATPAAALAHADDFDHEADPLELPHSIAMPAVTAPSFKTPLKAAASAAPANPLERAGDFVNRIWSHAVEAARSIGVQPRFMVGQAALESGWGKHEIRAADGSSSHNLFGVKAGRGWTGPVVEKTTTEYVNGVAQKTTAKFRVYGSYAEAFKDYATVLNSNPRYARVLGQSEDAKGFARGLQQAGYATDPAYADKLVRVINGATLRLGLQSEPAAQVLAQK